MVFSITNGDDHGTVDVLVEALTAMATTLRPSGRLPTVGSAFAAAGRP